MLNYHYSPSGFVSVLKFNYSTKIANSRDKHPYMGFGKFLLFVLSVESRFNEFTLRGKIAMIYLKAD